MQITIEIDEETAACIWANRTWEGRQPIPLAEIVKDLAEDEAANYKRHFAAAVPRVVKAFRETLT